MCFFSADREKQIRFFSTSWALRTCSAGPMPVEQKESLKCKRVTEFQEKTKIIPEVNPIVEHTAKFLKWEQEINFLLHAFFLIFL